MTTGEVARRPTNEDEPEVDELYAHLTRQLGLIPFTHYTTPFTIYGVGAVGSFLAYGLAKSGFTNITVFDDDKVSIENMSCSMYRRRDIDKDKVEALKEIIVESAEIEIKTEARRFAGEDEFGYAIAEVPPMGISVMCVDSMKARKQIWDVHKKTKLTSALLIDSRMSAEEVLIYVLKPAFEIDREMYEKTLYTDEQAVQERCTEKATFYTACGLAAQIINNIKCVLTKTPDEYPRVTQWSIKHSDLVVHTARHNAIDS